MKCNVPAAAFSIMLVFTVSSAAEEPTAQSPIVGEVRTIAMDSANQQISDALHKSGWAEASGQIAGQRDFPELFQTIGRSWTASPRVASDQFQLPNLRRSEDFDIDEALRSGLTCGDLLSCGDCTAGRSARTTPTARLVQWIYVGRDATSLAAQPGSRNRQP